MKSLSMWFGAVTAMLMLAGAAAADDAIFAGKVKSVDAIKKTCVLTDAEGKDHTFALDDSLTINNAGKESKADLKAGDAVQVCYDHGLTKWNAHYIVVQEGDSKNWTLTRCTFKSYDPAKKQMIVTDTADKKDINVTMGDAKVCLNGKANNMDTMKVGDSALMIVDRPSGVEPTLKAFLAWRQ